MSEPAQETTTVAKKVNKSAKPKVAAPKAEPKAAAKKAVTKPLAPGERRSEATKMIVKLIMANAKLSDKKKLTDAEIFDQVATKHGLPPERRTMVSWYRAALRREGNKGVPAAFRRGE